MIFIIRLQAQLHALASDPTTYTKDPDPQVLSLLSYAICSTQPNMQIKLISTCAGCFSRRLDLLPGHSGAGLEAGRDLRADDQQRPREETLQQPRPLHCASQALLGEVLLQGGSHHRHGNIELIILMKQLLSGSPDRPAGSKETGT